MTDYFTIWDILIMSTIIHRWLDFVTYLICIGQSSGSLSCNCRHKLWMIRSMVIIFMSLVCKVWGIWGVSIDMRLSHLVCFIFHVYSMIIGCVLIVLIWFKKTTRFRKCFAFWNIDVSCRIHLPRLCTRHYHIVEEGTMVVLVHYIVLIILASHLLSLPYVVLLTIIFCFLLGWNYWATQAIL